MRIGIFAFILLFLAGCEVEEQFTPTAAIDQQKTLANLTITPCELGQFHNVALDAILAGVPANQTANSEVEGMEFMSTLYDQSAQSTFSNSDASFLTGNKVAARDLLHYARAEFPANVVEEVHLNTAALLANGIITQDEHDLFRAIMHVADDVAALAALEQQWNNLSSDSKLNEEFVSFAFCVAYDSNDYWSKYNGQHGPLRKITPVHADIGGVLIGTGLGLLSGNDLSTSLAGGIITGVVASSGIAGRIGKWLFR